MSFDGLKISLKDDIIKGFKNKYQTMLAVKCYKNRVLALGLLVVSIMNQGMGVAFAKTNPYLITEDGIVGENAYFRGENFSAGSDLDLNLEKADQSQAKFVVKTDENGVFDLKVSGKSFEKAGLYYAYVSDEFGKALTAKTSFNVISSETSLDQSKVNLIRPLVKADGNDQAIISVELKDYLGNGLTGRVLKAYSDRSSDRFVDNMVITNEDGAAKFYLKSNVEGISKISILDTVEDVILKSDLKISFTNNLTGVEDIGGDLLQIANAAESGPLNGFEFDSLPATIKPNESVSFKLKAIDADAVTVQDYTGTVRFSVEGDNSSGVSLPPNYKFLAEDLGEHQFSLGLSFAKAGTYKLIVNDLNDKFKKGEKTVVVADSGSSPSGTTENKPIISSPTAGTYSQSEQLISGTAKSSSTIKIYDNNQLIGTVPVGPSGKFSYQTGALANGKHSIYVVNTNTVTEELIGNSDTVEINIDIIPPVIEDLQLDPEKDIQPGTVIKVKVFSEKGLSEASLLFNFDIVQLNASIDDPSVYVGEIQAPQDPGSYKMGVLLVDELKNEKTYDDQATVIVDAGGGTVEKNPDLTKPADNTEVPPVVDVPEIKAGLPSLVSGLIAYGSDHKVTLVWEAANDDKLVKNYKVYYGDNVKTMDKIVLTKDASTTWYVPNLENGKEYFFAVAAIDDEGNESEAKSEIVSGIPFKLEINNALSESPTKPLQDDNLKPAAYSGPFPQNTTKTGPELLLIGLSSLTASGFVLSRKKNKR